MRPRVGFHGKLNERDPFFLVPVDRANGQIGLAVSMNHEIALNFEKGRHVVRIPNSDRVSHRPGPWMNLTANQHHHDTVPPGKPRLILAEPSDRGKRRRDSQTRYVDRYSLVRIA